MIIKDRKEVLGYWVKLPYKEYELPEEKDLICQRCYNSIKGEENIYPKTYLKSNLPDDFDTIVCDKCGFTIAESKK